MDNVKADYQAYSMNLVKCIVGLFTLSTFYLVMLYRFSSWCYRKGIPILPYSLKAMGISLFGASIQPSARIGPGFRVVHSVGVVIGRDVVAGRNLELFQNTTLGGRDRNVDGRTMPTIGDNVTIFAGAVVLGPVKIGDNSSIGANAVVTRDIPANSIAAGAPARVINKVDAPHSLRSSGVI